MLFHVESTRTQKGMSLRYLAHLLRERGHRITKDGLQQRALGKVDYTMKELKDIAQLLCVKVEALYELEPHDEADVCQEEAAHV